MSEQDLQGLDLNTMRGVQEALTKLGLDPGTVDGFDGPHTQRAVREFQERAGIGVDGIVGPHTRAALKDALLAIERRTDDVAKDGQTDGTPQQ
jgi:peptidoglycan hydrolase-like protein with peptidoglycan-binding domain